MISDRSDNTGFKSSLVKLPLDPSKNSLLSNEQGKKAGDKKTNDFKQSNEISNNRRKFKSFENDSIFEAYEEESIKKKNKKGKEKIEKIINKTIVDDIENIYSCLNGRNSKRNSIQKIILLTIPFFTSLCHWVFLFLTKSKLENNYCFSDLNQFDNCVVDQICGNKNPKINIIIYNETYDISDNSLSDSKKFIKEMKDINMMYKTFFMSYYYNISKDKLLSSVDAYKYTEDKINFAVVLSKKEQWNIFLWFNNICSKDNIYIFLLIIIIGGGSIGSIIFCLLADMYGRKKIIIALLLLVLFSFTFLIAISYLIDKKWDSYVEEFNSILSIFSDYPINLDIIKDLYVQAKFRSYFESMIPLYFVCLLVLCISLRPLNKISLALLLENSVSDLNVLENFRKYNFVTTGIPHFLGFIILILSNSFLIFLIIMEFFFFVLLITSIIFINESIRYHYEYCEWKDLTNEVHSLFKITEELPINYKNDFEFEAFKIEENRQANGNYMKRINSIFEYIKQRLTYLKRDIRRNSNFIIKKEEVKFNPLVILTSLSANRVFNRLKFLLLIILFIINIQIFFVERELVEAPMIKLSDLYLGLHNNYIINSNYFILMIVALISNFFYYSCYRISCFKLVFYPSLVMLTILLGVYHYISRNASEIPVNLNFANFHMQDYYIRRKIPGNTIICLYFIYFFLIGINFYVNILVLKITKTLYRCSLLGIKSFLELLALAFGETLKFQINNCFLLIAGLNSIGIVSELYLGELKGIPNIINDLKQNIKIEDNKNKEKSKKTVF